MTTPHPVLFHFQRILEALGRLERHDPNLMVVLDVGPRRARLLVVPHEDWAAIVPSRLLPLSAAPGTHHVQLALAKLEQDVAAHARGWNAATRAVPGLRDLCGDGMLTAQWAEGKLYLSWTPRTALRAAKNTRMANIDHPIGAIFLDTMAKALNAVSQDAPVPVRLFAHGGDRDASTFYGDAVVQPALVARMAPMLTNDFHRTGETLDVGVDGVTVAKDAAFHAAVAAIAPPDSAAIAQAEACKDDWLAHLGSGVPSALKRIRFTANARPGMEVVHLADEPEDMDPHSWGPFTTRDQAWLDGARRLWDRFVAALPPDGLWATAGMGAMLYAEHLPVADGAGPQRFLSAATVHFHGQGVLAYAGTSLPRSWFLRSDGAHYLVQLHGQRYATRVRAENPTQAAALAWRAAHLGNIHRMPAKVWRMV